MASSEPVSEELMPIANVKHAILSISQASLNSMLTVLFSTLLNTEIEYDQTLSK
jgi:hypothetical protein